MRTDFDALIVGAGPAGSSAAILLARAGWSVALVEKQRFRVARSAANAWPRATCRCSPPSASGRRSRPAAGPELRRVALMAGERRSSPICRQRRIRKVPLGQGARPRDARHPAARTGPARPGRTCCSPGPRRRSKAVAGDWRCAVDAPWIRGRTELARAAGHCGAYGSWEALPLDRQHRRQISLAPADLLAFKANFRDASLDEGLLPVLSFAGGYGGMVVADGGLTTVACCIRRDRLVACRQLQHPRCVPVTRSKRCSGATAAAFASPCRPPRAKVPWLAAGPLDPGIHACALTTALLRIGNAAGEAHPIIGEGMSMALQSAWLLVCATARLAKRSTSSLIPGLGQDELARRYAAAWRQPVRDRACIWPRSSPTSRCGRPPPRLLMALAGKPGQGC
jgi:hypothetical protein